MDQEKQCRAFVRKLLPKLVTRDSGLPTIVGYAAVFYRADDPRTVYPMPGGHEERIAPGAFRRAISEDDVRALFNHDPTLVLGRTSSGTLKLTEDARGLRYEITPPDSDIGRRVVEALQRGDITGSSFGFVPREMDTERADTGFIRTLTDVKLFDVGPVTFPAYEATTAGVKRSTQSAKPETSQKSHGPNAAALRMRLDLMEISSAEDHRPFRWFINTNPENS